MNTYKYSFGAVTVLGCFHPLLLVGCARDVAEFADEQKILKANYQTTDAVLVGAARSTILKLLINKLLLNRKDECLC